MYRIAPGSIDPQRVPIMRPSTAVNPMVEAMLRPFFTAQRLAPLPRCRFGDDARTARWLAAHLRPLATLAAFIVMAAISVLTFEGMSIAIERFMHQRVIEVVGAREAFDAAKLKLDDEAATDARYRDQFDRNVMLTISGAVRRRACRPRRSSAHR
jgi:hypothetical protein